MTAVHVRGRVYRAADDVVDELWVLDGAITYDKPSVEVSETITGYVVPGLVDAHCHVGLDRHGAVAPEVAESHALADRDGGTLLIRDAGSPADTRWIHDRPDLPRLVRAGRHIARTRRYIPGYAWEVEPDQLVETVRQEARSGEGWVKLVGDWIDRDLRDLAPCWPVDVVTEAITAAHDEGARVTAHCFSEDSLPQLAAAGIDCIEHATGLTPDTISTFAEQGIAIVPTLINIATFPDIAASAEVKFPAYAAHMRDLHARRYETISAAHEAGVPVYCGTDAGGTLAHGLAGREILELARTSLGPRGALDAAVWGARAWLGFAGIEEGAPADLVVFEADPFVDLDVVTDPHKIVLRGQLIGPA